MADYLNIAGRVRTTASDGVAMEAQEVKDLNLNKSQQEVNADVQTELSDRYTKEETYSQEELNSLITTPDVDYVTVVATNQTTAVTDVLPATGSADTIYRVANWDGTQYDTTKYSLYAWNSTAYVCLAVRSFAGEIYDISANHPDGQGNPAVYTNLTNALGTNGANVPSSIRRGGMTVKFIQITAPAQYSVAVTEGLTEQPTGTELLSDPDVASGTYTADQLTAFSTLPTSTGAGNAVTYWLEVTGDTTTYTTYVITLVQGSDNKYVQYRLMSDTFNTTVANWQGVDDEPTVGSDNFVKSRGILKADRNVQIENAGFSIPFVNKSYKDILFGTALPVGTIISDFGSYTGTTMYLIREEGDAFIIQPSQLPYKTSVSIIGFKPTNASEGTFVVRGNLKTELLNAESNIDYLLNDQLVTTGIDVSFVSKSYKKVYFGRVVPQGTVLNRGDYDGIIYLYDANDTEYTWFPYSKTKAAPADLVYFKPTTADAGRITSAGIIDNIEKSIEMIDNKMWNYFGVLATFNNQSYQKIPFDQIVPVGAVLNNNGYAGMIYLYDIEGNELQWNPASRTYTTAAKIEFFSPTTSGSGTISCESILNGAIKDIESLQKGTDSIRKDLGRYNVSIWGGSVNTNTGQLYGPAYNAYHFSEIVPINGETSVYCSDSQIDCYMYYSSIPIIGDNSSIYIGQNTSGRIPTNTKFAIVVFKNRYVPSVQPFPVYTNNVFFTKKMQGKKLITIGDSLTQICAWQPKLSRYSDMIWSYYECYSGVGYVNLSDGTYTTEDKSGDANYRNAYCTAYAGTGIKPTSNSSIYIRSLDSKYYEPDVIIVYGGENDSLSSWKSSGNTGTTPDEIVANEVPYTDKVISSSVSTIAAYKGMIENLMEECPDAIIYIVTSMRVYGEIGKDVGGSVRFATVADVRQWEDEARYPKVEYMRAIAKYYNLPVIDLWNKSGINNYNAANWYGATGDDAVQVHPNTKGYLRMADVMLQCL